jgi:ferric-dicitrate binding protein FerR (iron transport regulator)
VSRDHHDALIDQLLREILGGDRPRDITARVVAQARIHDRFRRRWWIGAGSAAAACVAIAAGLALFWPSAYPSPRVTEGVVYSANGTEEMRAGATLVTDGENSGVINIGNYVNVVMAPDTSLTLGGKKYEENVVLNSGHVDVHVTRNKGRFDVLVGQAIVHVTGTKFALDVLDGQDATQSHRVKTLFVNVEEGSVDVQPGMGLRKTLKAGAREIFVISSEPMPVVPRLVTSAPAAAASTAPATTPAAPRTRTGTGAGMEQGVRFGNRGAALNRPADGRGLTAATRPLQANPGLQGVLLPPRTGKFDRNGTLSIDPGWVLLEASDGKLVLFPQGGSTVRGFEPRAGAKVHVSWENGKVVSIEPLPAATRPN